MGGEEEWWPARHLIVIEEGDVAGKKDSEEEWWPARRLMAIEEGDVAGQKDG